MTAGAEQAFPFITGGGGGHASALIIISVTGPASAS